MKQLNLMTIVALCLNGVLAAVLTGFSAYFDAALDRSYSLLNIAALVTIGWWIFADAAYKWIPLGLGSALGLVTFFPAFFIYYCFRSRGRQGWLLCAAGIGASLVYLLLLFAVLLLVSAFA
jgi:hypothetical protein